MTHFALISLPYLGHLNPALALASELARRGHRTTFLHIADIGALVRGRGHEFVALGRGSHPAGWLTAAAARLGRSDRLAELRSAMHDFAGLTAMFCEELPAALRDLRIDLVIADQYEAAGGMAAYRRGLPFVSLAAALPLNWDPSVPSPFVGWRPGATRWHRAFNVASNYGAWRFRAPINAVIGDYATRWRLGRGPRIEDYLSGFAQISQLVPSLDFTREALIGCFHYCGPLRDGPPPSPRRRGSGRAFVSLGSLQGHRADLLGAMARAARGAGFEPLIAHGGRLSRAEAAKLGRWAEVHAFVAQEEVLSQCDVAIVHGGLNTVLDAAARGVPLVISPIAFEQAAIAARVTASGAGRRSAPRPSPSLVRRVGGSPAYIDAAARLQGEIARAGGVGRAADIVECVAATGRPLQNAKGLARRTATASARAAPLDDHWELVPGF